MPERSEGEILNKLYSLVCTKIGFSEVLLVLQIGKNETNCKYMYRPNRRIGSRVGFESWIPIFTAHSAPSLVCTKIGFSEVLLVLQIGKNETNCKYMYRPNRRIGSRVGFESWIPIFTAHSAPKLNNVWKKCMCPSEARAKIFGKNNSFFPH